MRPDILVRDGHGSPVLAVEVKARQNVGSEWAAGFRRNLYAHGSYVLADYFMIVTSERIFLWNEQASGHPLDVRTPNDEISSRDVFGQVDSSSLAIGPALELVVSGWLSSVVRASVPTDLPESTRAFMVESGLFEALRGTVVGLELV